MAPFDIKEVRQLMEGDDLELDKIGDRKTALFCIVSDTDMTFNFIVNANWKLLFSAEMKCCFSPDSIQVYTALITISLVGLKPVKSWFISAFQT